VVSSGECGIIGVDVTDSSNPKFIARIDTLPGLAEEAAGIESADGLDLFIYVASYWMGLQIYEVVGDCDVNACTVNPRGSIGGTANENWGVSLAVWVAVVQGSNGPQIIAYVASSNGLQIVDVTNPDVPVELGSFDTNPNDLPLEELDDVPQDVVVSGGLAFVPLWIGGFIVIDVQVLSNPIEFQRFAAAPNTAFFKVEVSTANTRILATEGINGLAVFTQLADGTMVHDQQFAIGEGDGRCHFDAFGVSDVCWAWALDEVGELVGVTYGVLGSPLSGGFQLIDLPATNSAGAALEVIEAPPRPAPEPRLLLLQGIGVLAVAGLARLRRRRRERVGS
jgi:hypothetical protein